MGFSRDRKLAQLSHVEVLKKKLVENKAEVLFCIGREETIIASTVAVHNPFEFQKRDVYKPNQRKIFAMPPRIAKIMVNLSACTPGKVLLDPFCGVGTILQEAFLKKPTLLALMLIHGVLKQQMRTLNGLQRSMILKMRTLGLCRAK